MGSWLALLLLVLPAASPPDGALDPAFASRVREAKDLPYGLLAARFIEAGGRDGVRYTQEMDALARAFDQFLNGHGNPAESSLRAELLARFVFQQQKFDVDLNLSDAENLFPSAILQRRRGYCLGLALLLLDLGERRGWPVSAVAAPRHVFVRYGAPGDPVHFNIETTLGGERHDDEWYLSRFGLAGIADLAPLSPRALAAHFLNNHGYVLLEAGRLEAARREFDDALALHPQLVEARINLGVMHARQRNFAAALEHFDGVLSVWKHDHPTRANRAQTLVELDRVKDGVEQCVELLLEKPPPSEIRALVQSMRGRLHDRAAWEPAEELTLCANEILSLKDGKEPGLRAAYYSDTTLTARRLDRIDRDISFQWGWNAPTPELPNDRFSVAWDGWVEIPEDARYHLYVACSDGVRLWMDGRLVIDAWQRLNDNFVDAEVLLRRGLHDVRIEYFESIGEAGIKLAITSEKKPHPLPLADLLFHANGTAP